MFLSWEEAKQKYPNKWVVFKNPQYSDMFDMDFIGGEFVLTASNQKELFSSIPKGIGEFTSRHTREDEAVGLLKSGLSRCLKFLQKNTATVSSVAVIVILKMRLTLFLCEILNSFILQPIVKLVK